MSRKVISMVAIMLIFAVASVCFVACNIDDISVDERFFEIVEMSKEEFVATVAASSFLSGKGIKIDVADIEWAKEIKTLRRDGQRATAVKFVDESMAIEYANAIQARIDKDIADAKAEGVAVLENHALSSAVERRGLIVVYGTLGAVTDAVR